MVIILILSTFIILWVGIWKKPAVPSTSSVSPSAPKNTEIFFASNGKNSVYKIKKGDRWSVIWNGQEGKEYDAVSNPIFSSDGNQLAYSAELNGQAYVVVNNSIEINAYQKSGYLVFSQDGSTIAFVSTKEDDSFVVITVDLTTVVTGTVISGNESAEYEEIGVFNSPNGDATAIILSPDGEQVVFTIVEDDKIYIVVNDQQIGSGYDSITDLSINDEGEYSYTATIGETTITVVDNVVVSQTNPASQPPSGTIPPITLPTDTPSSSTDVYKYKISTQKDIHLDEDRLDYNACSDPSGNCNF